MSTTEWNTCYSVLPFILTAANNIVNENNLKYISRKEKPVTGRQEFSLLRKFCVLNILQRMKYPK